MAEIGSAFVSIAPSAKGFGSSLSSQVSGQTRTAGQTIGKTFGKMFVLGASVIAAAGVGNLLKGSIDEAREAQKVSAATEAIIKATGGAAAITADQVGQMAGRLSAVTGIDDEAIQSGANLLLTFKNVKNYVDGEFVGAFDRATASAVDLSAAGFGSIESSSKMLGKALNDPLKGITALSRAGVTFSDAQKEQIANFIETGDVAKAQNLILKEVESQVGGVAAATATSGEKASVAFGNMKEALGTALLPLVDTLARQFVKVAPAIQRGIGNIGPTIQKARAFLLPFIAGVVSTAVTLGSQLAPTLANVASAVGTFVTQMRDGTGVGGQVVAIFGQVASVLGAVFGFISNNQAVVATFVGIIATAVVVAKAFAAAQLLVNIALTANPIGIVVVAIAALVAGLVYAYKNSERFRAVVDATFGFIGKYVPKVIGAVVGFVKSHWKLLVVLIGGPIALVALLVVKHFGTIKRIVGNVADFVVASAQKYGQFVSAVIDKVGKVVKFFRDLPGKIKGFLTGLPGDLRRIGGQIIDGLVSGIKAAAGKVAAAVASIVNKIPKKIRDLMGISSPSKVTTDLGRMIGDGLARGIDSTAEKVSKATQKIVDKLKSQLDTVKSDFAGLKDSVAGAFTGGLFEATTAGQFITDLMGTKGQLQALKDAFAELVKDGWKPGVLAQLFQSGNGGLILDLAAQDQATSMQAAGLLGGVNSLSNQLGTSVADFQFGDKLDKIEKQLAQIRKNTQDGPERFGREINGAARGGRRLAAR